MRRFILQAESLRYRSGIGLLAACASASNRSTSTSAVTPKAKTDGRRTTCS